MRSQEKKTGKTARINEGQWLAGIIPRPRTPPNSCPRTGFLILTLTLIICYSVPIMEAVIRTAVAEALESLGLPLSDFVIEHPNELSHGDYACNVAMVASKAVGQSPRAIAEQIVAQLEGQIEYVEKIEIAGPGFINFYFTRDFFVAETNRIINLGENWGRNEVLEGESMLIEYTSPNLFKPLHIGNLVGNIIGEAYTRLCEFSGAAVVRINYPSDIGLTVAKGVWGLRHLNADPTDINALGLAYKTGNDAYEAAGTEKDEIIAINQSLYAGTDTELNTLRDAGIATSRKQLTELCLKLGTKFDTEITESSASDIGVAVVKENTGGIFEESDGAVVYKGEKVGLHTRVFLNSQGLPTYEAKDLGNFTLKQKQYPNWTQSVIVTGNEQTEYFKVLYAAIREVFPEAAAKELVHIPTGFLTLTTGKMSSRTGNVLTGESLFAEMEEAALERVTDIDSENKNVLAEAVAVAALKYQILKHNVGSNIVFDKEKALSFEGDSGPYLQYTHARINSVLKKAESAGVAPSYAVLPEQPYLIEKIIYRFEEVVAEAVLEQAPQKVVNYLTELAGAFNTFYAHEKMADATDAFAPYKCLLAQAVATTLKNGLYILAIKAPERL